MASDFLLYQFLRQAQPSCWKLPLQNFPHDSLEIILVEDRGGTEEGRKIAGEFTEFLPIVYAPLDANFG